MAIKWYQRATVQAAIIGAVGVCIAAIITMLAPRSTPPNPQVVVNQPMTFSLEDPDIIDKLAKVLARSLRESPEFRLEHKDIVSPQSVLLLVDTSPSVPIHKTKEAISQYIGTLRRHDLIGLITFNENVANLLPFGDFSAEELTENLQRAGRFTLLWDGINVAVNVLAKTPTHSNKLAIFSDFKDEGSVMRPIDVLPLVKTVGRSELELISILYRTGYIEPLKSYAATVWQFDQGRLIRLKNSR
jgi:hypothetical protein